MPNHIIGAIAAMRVGPQRGPCVMPRVSPAVESAEKTDIGIKNAKPTTSSNDHHAFEYERSVPLPRPVINMHDAARNLYTNRDQIVLA